MSVCLSFCLRIHDIGCNFFLVAINGWQESSGLEVVDFIQHYKSKGIQKVICTDIAKDGMLQGPSTELYQEILKNSNIELIASGGVSSMKDLIQLKIIGCEGAIIGKAIYEGKISLKELQKIC